MEKLTDLQKSDIQSILEEQEPGDMDGICKACLKIGTTMQPSEKLWDEIIEIVGNYN